MNATASGAPLAYSINEACQVTSLGRTAIYQLIRDGRLAAVKVGGRTLIPATALQGLLKADQ